MSCPPGNAVRAHPVLSVSAAKAWEQALLTTEEAEWSAMQRAGAAIARAIGDDFREIGALPPDSALLVLAGKGHNGGDALLAADAILQRCPRGSATVSLGFAEREMRPLARRALADLRERFGPRIVVLPFGEAPAAGSCFAVCLDGLFGFQFRPPMKPAHREWIERVNGHSEIRLRAAIDLPSGMGETSGDAIFRADFTYATGIVKEPVVADAAVASVGRLRYLDLGFFEGNVPEAALQILTAPTLAPLGLLRSPATDKRSYGHLLIVGGSRSYPGAVVLAARAALRSGAGLVTAFVPATLAPECAAAHPEVMWVGCPETAYGGLDQETVDRVQERASRATALLAGPGLSAEPAVVAMLERLVSSTDVPLVLDADALRPEILRAAGSRVFVCTPHGGEFKRIEPTLYQRGEFLPARGVLVLKGPRTRIVAAGAPTLLGLFGGPVLARGGSGDMLAGLIGGLLAQTPADPVLAACRGVVWHGLAADLLARTHGQVAVEVSQLLEQLGPALHS